MYVYIHMYVAYIYADMSVEGIKIINMNCISYRRY